MQDDWLNEFRRRHGRGLRVLHIGNIANNAYHNARLLQKSGVDCDVLCADYYHIMGCPEWEDADFRQQRLDHFRPDWSRLDLGGFVRPRWFVQGPLERCLKYLLLKHEGAQGAADNAWRFLSIANRTAKSTPREWIWLRCLSLYLFVNRIYRFFLLPERVAARIEELSISARRGSALRHHVLVCLLKFWGRPLVWMSHLTVSVTRILAYAHGGEGAYSAFLRRANHLAESFGREFPERADRLAISEMLPYMFQWQIWGRVFAHYDIVQGYAGDVAIPLIAGNCYTAFEHGTLREIPYRPTTQGRLTALGYRMAAHTFVTNMDCVESARVLAKKGYTFVNHPYGEACASEGTESTELRSRLLSELDADFLIFHPTRHDWVAGTGYADKDNHVLLEAFASLRASFRVGLICCAWGQNIEDSIALLEQAGVTAHVSWRYPMGMVEFGRYALACDVVADQFKLGAFGGITFKAMAMGGVVCTYLNEQAAYRMFDELPPVLNCGSAAEIVGAVNALYADPHEIKRCRVRSKDWMSRYHAGAQTVRQQLEVYRRVLGEPYAEAVN